MGVIGRGILGGFSGKVANVVGGSWKGVAYMRSLPLSVANPKTAGQVAQRNNMTAIVAWSKLMLTTIVKPLNDRFAQKQSGYNLFVSRNIGKVDLQGVPNMPSIVLSEGSLEGAENLTQSYVPSTNLLTLGWDDNSGTGSALGTDKVYAVSYNNNTGELQISSAQAVRSATELDIQFDNLTAADLLQSLVSFLRADGSIVSTSQYISSTT